MQTVQAAVDSLAARTGFSGVVRIDRGGRAELATAYGCADRRQAIPAVVDSQFALASGTKSLTALVLLRLIEDGLLELATTARAVLGGDLPLIDAGVTVEQLLSHTSGIGDYLDEAGSPDFSAYLMPVPVHELATTEGYLAVLDGHPAAFPPGRRFAYCNSGYVVLALIAERVSGVPFDQLVRRRVCEPAGMADTAFLRSDELPARAAVGYLEADGLWTNVFHLPVRGSGDGGIYSTAADVSALWAALFAGRIVSPCSVAALLRPSSARPPGSARYSLGFWLHPTRELVMMEGRDAGVSFRSVHDPASETTWTVLCNTTDGAWPITTLLDELLGS